VASVVGRAESALWIGRALGQSAEAAAGRSAACGGRPCEEVGGHAAVVATGHEELAAAESGRVREAAGAGKAATGGHFEPRVALKVVEEGGRVVARLVAVVALAVAPHHHQHFPHHRGRVEGALEGNVRPPSGVPQLRPHFALHLKI